nr:DUF1285 domain-containing protein [Pseudovibrio axinellae]
MPKGLQALISRAGTSKSLPPIHLWNPEFCGDLDMQIKRDGSWYYMGTPIQREALVHLFSTVLRQEKDGKFYLVTPVEKIGLTVEDAPFVAVEMDIHAQDGEQVITLRTNCGDVVEAGPDHPIRFVKQEEGGGLKPYIVVRDRLEALFARPLVHELAPYLQVHDSMDGRVVGVESHGEFFVVDMASNLEF